MRKSSLIAQPAMAGPESLHAWVNPPDGWPAAPAWRWLRALSSPRLTLALIVLVAGGVLWAYWQPGSTTWPMVLPLGLVSANLVAAIAVHPVLRQQMALLVFHLALLAVIGLVAVGRLTYLKGHAELTTGEQFEGRLTEYDSGPWHPWGVRSIRFRNESFVIDYLSGRQRDHTYNRVSFIDADGRPREFTIGDQVPLVLGGYRFYTSFNKGYALTFLWEPQGGAPQRGTVHLPAYPIHEFRQANTWVAPGTTTEVWVQLRFDQPLIDPNGPDRFRTPGSHSVVVRTGERRAELTPGKRLEIAGGRLTYEGVGTWMGYKVFYDWTLPWLLAACAVAGASLGAHFLLKFARRPWRSDESLNPEAQ
jgi:cytochrome c biogenesis protein